jgi:hypothetical protein
MSTYQQYLATLRRIPDDVILSMATRDIDLADPYRCVCGWAVREMEARKVGLDAGDVSVTGILFRLDAAIPGHAWEWSSINGAHAGDSGDALADAFTERVLECVS